MDLEEPLSQWDQKSQEVAQSLQEWRKTHPKATMAEIEEAVDAQMNQLRARVIEDVVGEEVPKQSGKPQALVCPHCGERMQRRGKHQRSLQSQGGQRVSITRQYHSCPACGYSFFPPR